MYIFHKLIMNYNLQMIFFRNPSNLPPLPSPCLLLLLSNFSSFQSSPPPGGVDFNAGGNGGTLLMEEGSKRDAKTETIFEEPLDDQLSSRWVRISEMPQTEIIFEDPLDGQLSSEWVRISEMPKQKQSLKSFWIVNLAAGEYGLVRCQNRNELWRALGWST